MFGNLAVDEDANVDKMDVESKSKTRKIKKNKAKAKLTNKKGSKRRIK